jgi:hypothetical protein
LLVFALLSLEVRADEPPTPSARPPVCDARPRRHHLDLRPQFAAPCKKPPPPSRLSNEMPDLRPPDGGLGLRLGVLLAAGSEARFGAGAQLGLSYFGERLEVGPELLLLGMWAEESGFEELFVENGFRSNRDISLVPRLRLSWALDRTALVRAHALGGFGKTSLEMTGEPSIHPQIERSVWSWTASLGLSVGIVILDIGAFGYMSRVEKFSWSLLETTASDTGELRGAPGVVVSLGILLPIRLSGSARAKTP